MTVLVGENRAEVNQKLDKSKLTFEGKRLRISRRQEYTEFEFD